MFRYFFIYKNYGKIDNGDLMKTNKKNNIEKSTTTKIIESIKKLIITNSYDCYLIGLGLLTYLSYVYDLHMFLLPLFIIISGYFVYKKASFLYIIPTAFFLQMSAQNLGFSSPLAITYIIIYVLLIITDVIVNRKVTKIGVLFDPFLVLVIASVLTIVNAPTIELWLGGMYYILVAFLSYLYFTNATDNDKGNLVKVTKIFLYTSVLVTFQMFHIIGVSELDILTVISQRRIDLGWENINIVIYVNLLAIILATKLMIDSKFKAYYMILTLLSTIGVLLTLSRSSILTIAIYCLFIIPYVVIKSKNKVNLVINGLIVVIFMLVMWFVIESGGIGTGYVEALFSRDIFNYDNRYELLVIAWGEFKSHFIVGSGGLYTSRYYLSDIGALNYHNTIAQVSTLGTIGLLGFIWLFYEKIKMIIKKNSSWKWIVLILVIGTAFINGSFQPMYFHVNYMLYLLLLLATFENVEEDDEIL